MMKNNNKKPFFLFYIFAFFLVNLGPFNEANARVYLDITSADLRKLPVAVPSFEQKMTTSIKKEGVQMADLLGKSLAFHGFISIVPSKTYNEDRNSNWKTVGADFVILGNYDAHPSGKLVIELRLIDAYDNRMVLGKRYNTTWERSNKMIRKFADDVIMHLSGEQGISNTKIAFISDKTGHKEVYVADILGEEVRQVTGHNSITVSPRFSPDGTRLAYTSYHRGNPNLYLTRLSQKKTTKAISWRPGLNVAPAWAPNGNSMITTLSKDDNPDLYLMGLDGKIINRLTRNEGINVSASWAPDGKRFAFVSDRSGKPQIYIMNIDTKITKRITYYGKENTTPAWSPKGDLIAYTGRDNGNYHLFIISPDGGDPTKLTKYWGNYESPSWSPDGKQIVFSRLRNEKHQLCTIFLKGKGIRPLLNIEGNQKFPQWSTRLKY